MQHIWHPDEAILICLKMAEGGVRVAAVYEWIRNLTAFFLFLSVLENLLPGDKYGKYIRLFAGMVLVLLAVEPFAESSGLEEILARSYEGLIVREEVGQLPDGLDAAGEERMEHLLAQYEEAVGQDVRRLAEDCGLSLLSCRVQIGRKEDGESFCKVMRIFAVLPAQSDTDKEKQLSNKIQEYYGLEERYVEIEIAAGERPVDLSADGGGDPVYSGIPGGK